MKRILLYTLFVACIFFACKKKEPLPPEGDGNPVFSFTGQVDADQVSFQAGNNDYYMHTSFYRDSALNTYVYDGDLRPGCGSCDYGIRFLINDYKPTAPNSAMVID